MDKYLFYTIFLFFSIFLINHCATNKKNFNNNIPIISNDEYQALSWKEKKQFFSKFNFSNLSLNQKNNIAFSLNTDNNKVINYLLSQVIPISDPFFHESYVNLLEHTNSIVRLQAFQALLYLDPKRNKYKLYIYFFKKMLQSSDWIIQEYALQQLRTYSIEKKDKKLFYIVLRLLTSRNINVIREVCRNLRWYNNKKVIPLIYRRALAIKSDVELILMINELAHYKHKNYIYNFLVTLSKKHKSSLVRSKAKSTLR